MKQTTSVDKIKTLTPSDAELKKLESEKDEPVAEMIDAESAAIASDSFKLYLRDISAYPLLTQAEEIDLAVRIRDGQIAAERLKHNKSLDEDDVHTVILSIDDAREARETLINSNLRLVVSIAKRYLNRGLSFLDLIQEGNAGLIVAADKFDVTKGFKFSTYATWWIRQAVTRAIADQSRTIRIPVHMVEAINKMNVCVRALQQELGREPSDSEIAAKMGDGMTPAKVRSMQTMSVTPISLDMSIGSDDDSVLSDFIEDRDCETPTEYTSRSMVSEELDKVLSDLTPKQRDILEMRYGLKTGECMTLEEVGKAYSVSRERIRQIESAAIRKLRQKSRLMKLGDWRDAISDATPVPDFAYKSK
jgi:RNA polymerase primary sigma factor